VDFLFMIGCVELIGLSPVRATAISAAIGGVTNFVLLRSWAYRRGADAVKPQFLRYLLVASTSLGLNTGGEHLLVDIVKLQYILARIITAIIVSNAWNYPMDRFFVFAHRKAPT
jgi:putative flippase GtrA